MVASVPALYQTIFGTPLKWVAILAPLAVVLLISFCVGRITTAQARTAFFAFAAAVIGVSMASIFLVFAGTSIALAFVSAAAVFAGMSLWGYTTNIDLSRWSTFLMVGPIRVVIPSLVNLFVGSSTLQLVFSIAGVLMFTVLTARDTQRLESKYLAYAGTERAEKLAVMGALSLHLNLVDLFQLLLSLFDQREE
ncbi:Bax inhibitor-1/YccA family protein [Sphingomonas sp. PL-96]|uniref:Bax inhibitor-1/YccA family protein n=1 Tax=Sphingomonas sp. PL-96 TaxID=2887201 RepID=UPI001E49C13C|nr:Bax inhibitor-1/YccA family protein [Sphingomonas sp. PL-96]MCC2978259.1 Bax inhibitor-1/YccA family protein [Sphingomonas sp. PL-96]